MLYVKNLERVRIFLHVVEKGSISAACKQLRKSQTSISNSVCNLEIDLGIDLLTRDGHKACPTPEAKKLIPYFENLLSYEAKISSAIKDIYDTKPSLNIYLDNALPNNFCEATGDIITDNSIDTVSIYRSMCTDSLTQSTDMLNKIAVIASNEDLKIGHLAKCSIGYIRANIVVSSSHELAANQNVTHAHLSKHRQFIIPDGSTYISRPFKPISTTLSYVETFSDILKLVKMGLGWGIVPSHYLEGDVAEGSISVLNSFSEPKGVQIPVSCYYSPALESSILLKSFLDRARSNLQGLNTSNETAAA